MQTTRTFEKIVDGLSQHKRITSVCSGMRCGKSVAISQILVLIASTQPNKVITIITPTIRHTRTGIWRDLMLALQDLNGMYELNLSSFSIKFHNGSIIDCVSYMESGADRAKGHQQNICFFNELPESADYEIYKAVMGRTSEWAIADWNPSISRNWWFQTQILNKDPENVAQVRVNLYDNQYLTATQRQQIEDLARFDERFRLIYLEGQYADTSEQQIITNYVVVPHDLFVNEFERCSNYAAGLDFGFVNSYNALCEIGTQQGELWITEKLYRKGMLNDEIAKAILSAELHNPMRICADNELKSIAEINKHGGGKLHIIETKKFKGSQVAGYNAIKKFKLHIDSESENLIRDIQSAEWLKDKTTGEILNETNKAAYDPHMLDSVAYCVTAYYNTPSKSRTTIC